MNRYDPRPAESALPGSRLDRPATRGQTTRSFVGLRGTANGPQGQEVGVWTLWTSGDLMELALEAPLANAFASEGWSIDLPGAGQFEVRLLSRRGTTCRIQLANPASQESATLKQAALRH